MSVAETLCREQVVVWLEETADALQAARDALTELDSAIGDADHGINMDRGFQKVRSLLPTLSEQDIGSILKAVGVALIGSVGGAAGPLYGTGFLRASSVTSGLQELSPDAVGSMLRAMLTGIVERGRAAVGAKTMVDAMTPAVEAYNRALTAGAGICSALQTAVDAAEQGVHATIPMQATKGRASYLGERSIGHQDPGATSCALLLKALHSAACKRRDV
jgi:phosphoenolpyruvate---glycerone phosphotransferase subunit DhaL